jgi:hypothetical protein
MKLVSKLKSPEANYKVSMSKQKQQKTYKQNTNTAVYIIIMIIIWLPHQYPICIPLLPHSCYMPCPSQPPSFDHSNYA